MASYIERREFLATLGGAGNRPRQEVQYPRKLGQQFRHQVTQREIATA
jgi:hypothetical protein